MSGISQLLINEDGTYMRSENNKIIGIRTNGELVEIEENDLQTEDILNEEQDKFVFDDNKTRLLLSTVLDNKQKLRDKSNKRNLFAKIADEFSVIGFKVTIAELDRKFRNLKSTYLKIKDHNGKTGRDRKKAWEFYNIMEEIFAHDVAVNATSVLKIVSSINTDTKTAKFNEGAGCSKDPQSPLSVNKEKERFSDKENFKRVSSTCETPSVKRRRVFHNEEKPEWVQQLLRLQEKQISEIADLKKHFRESNEIQAERNNLLQKFLEKQ